MTDQHGESAAEERPPNPATLLRRFQAAHPDWTFQHDAPSGRWIAARGHDLTLIRCAPVALRLAIDTADKRARP
ncbi:hypothetical protein AGRA3207_007440 [Actinomadura graeca]|uniref:Cytochrome P450 n=1 Tax=Actinomadura graeca TaxID=2750812 RepID=A0ABX8R492_9ACTN|nr:hypothetical protein [Actinomadura graeca]QXJ25875.1 hypothetical protein AGRA3207_007440 [Actinomadura graeca]